MLLVAGYSHVESNDVMLECYLERHTVDAAEVMTQIWINHGSLVMLQRESHLVYA